jgi:hypothetical protein
MISLNLNHSIEEAEGVNWGKAPSGDTWLVKECYRLRKLPLHRFTSADLCRLLRQNIGSAAIAPVAVEMLRSDPFLEAEFYPGDLAVALMQLGADFWDHHSELRTTLALLIDTALADEAGWTLRIGKTGVRSVRRARNSFATG